MFLCVCVCCFLQKNGVREARTLDLRISRSYETYALANCATTPSRDSNTGFELLYIIFLSAVAIEKSESLRHELELGNLFFLINKISF